MASFNIHHGAPPRRRFSRTELARSTQRLGVDLLVLQEVDRHVIRSHFADQTCIVAKATGLSPVFAKARRLGPFGAYGIALLAPDPPLAVEIIKLPRFGGEQRVAILASVRIDGRRITVCGTHLQNNAAIAKVQLGVVLDRMMQRPGPHLLMGDLNAGPNQIGAQIAEAGLISAEAVLTFPTHDPRLSIDWIAASGLSLGVPSVPDTWLSDHFPLIVSAE